MMVVIMMMMMMMMMMIIIIIVASRGLKDYVKWKKFYQSQIDSGK